MPGRHRRSTIAIAAVSAVELVLGITGAAALVATDDDEPAQPARAAQAGQESAENDTGPESRPGRSGCRTALAGVAPAEGGRVLQVVGEDETGSDDAEDDAGASAEPGVRDAVFGSINEALEAAGPGDVVRVAPGTYDEEVRTVSDGESDAPIRIVGPQAHLEGDEVDEGRLVEITNDHVTLEGFELSNADKLVWVEDATGVRIVCNELHDAGGECVRLKVFASENEIARNSIRDCGQENFDLDDDSKNGEGVYIGTAPEQLDRNPTDEPDTSNRNWVHHNLISVPAECVDVKEAAETNVIEDNLCVGSEDPDNAGFSSRGQGTILRRNVSTDHAGAGIRLGGDAEDDGVDSVVVANELVDNEGYGLKIMRAPQQLVCGNVASGNGDDPVNVDGLDISRPCPGDEPDERGLPPLSDVAATPANTTSRERRRPSLGTSGEPGPDPGPETSGVGLADAGDGGAATASGEAAGSTTEETTSDPGTSNDPGTDGDNDGDNDGTDGGTDGGGSEEPSPIDTVEETAEPVTEPLDPVLGDAGTL